MKKIITITAQLMVMFAIILTIAMKPHSFIFATYPDVFIDHFSEKVDNDKFESDLDQLATDSDSLIARRVVVPSEDRGTNFVYRFYGTGDKPAQLKESTSEQASSSDLAASYLLISGDISEEQLSSFFESHGAEVRIFESESAYQQTSAIFLNPSLLTTLIIFIFAAIGVSLIDRIDQYRSLGIRLISGDHLSRLIFKEILKDTLGISLSTVIAGFLGSVLLSVLSLHQSPFNQMLWIGLILNSFVLLIGSAATTMIFFVAKNHLHLKDILKGKMPYKVLLSILLVIQVFAVILVGRSIYAGQVGVQGLEDLNQGEKAWAQFADRYHASYALSAFHKESQVENERRDQLWYQLFNDAISHHDAIFAKNNLPDLYPIGGEMLMPGDKRLDAPALYVSPNYLNYAELNLDDALSEKASNLGIGEYLLLIPDRLNSDQENICAYFERQLSNLAHDDYEMTSTPAYEINIQTYEYPSGQSAFILNTYHTGKWQAQFFDDPILLVLTPKSTGNTLMAAKFWSSEAASLHFNGFHDATQLAKKHGVYPYISYLNNGQQKYHEAVQEQKIFTFSMLVGSVLGILTAIMLFTSMHAIYFNQFRRDIFIKTISGMTFLKNHQTYLLCQLGIFILSLVLTAYLGFFIYGLLAVLIFTLISGLTMYSQSRREKLNAVTVLKGA